MSCLKDKEFQNLFRTPCLFLQEKRKNDHGIKTIMINFCSAGVMAKWFNFTGEVGSRKIARGEGRGSKVPWGCK